MPLTALLRMLSPAQPLTCQPRFKNHGLDLPHSSAQPEHQPAALTGMMPDLNLPHFAHRRHDHSQRRIYCSSAEFDIHEQPEPFVRVMVGYLMMSDTELGFCYPQRMVGGEWRSNERGLKWDTCGRPRKN